MHNSYQEDDIYNEAARRLGAGDIVLGKQKIRENVEFSLKEIRKIKFFELSLGMIFIFSFAIYFLSYLLRTYTNGKNFEPHMWRVILPSFLLPLAIAAFNLGRIVQYVPIFSKRFLHEHRNIPIEIESLFDDLGSGPIDLIMEI